MLKRSSSAASPPLPQTALLDDILAVHQLVQVVWEKSKHNCRVQDFDRQTISFSAPTNAGGQPILFKAGTSLEIMLQVESSLYVCTGRVLTNKVMDSIPVVVLAKPKKAKSSERRGYFRVWVNMELMYKRVDEQEYRHGRMVDISGGGVLCQVRPEFYVQPGDKLDLQFDLPAVSQPVTVTVVVRKVSSKVNGLWRRIACEYDQITAPTREKIIFFVSQRQLELIKAGLL